MTAPRVLVALCLALPLACGGTEGDDATAVSGVVVDTLESGAVRVRNPEAGVWGEGEAWRLVEEIRIGSADGTGADAFTRVADLAVGPAGRIWVLDGGEQDVRVFTASGEWVRTIGREGGGPGEFRNPSGIRFGPEGALWVVDATRYSVFDTTGALLVSHRRPAMGAVRDFGFDGRGRLLEVVSTFDPDGRRTLLLRHRPGESRVDTLRFPKYQQPFVKEESGDRAMWFSVPFTPRLQFDFAPDGLWVGTGETYRIVHTSFEGDTVRIVERAHRPAPVTDEDEEMVRRANLEAPNGAIEMGEIKLPETHPAYSLFFVTPTGYVWVSAIRGDDAGGMEVFDPAGRYLGRVRSVTRFFPRVHAFDRDRLYSIVHDELGIPYVIGLRVERTPGSSTGGAGSGG